MAKIYSHVPNFSTNHLSYTKTLVLIYKFRTIIYFDGAAIFFLKMCFFCPKIKKKNFAMSCFSRSPNCSSSISRYMFGHIWGLD